MIQKKHEVDNALVISVLAAIAGALLAWNCIVVYDIQKDVKEIKTTVNTMHKTLTKLARFQIDTDISAESE
tara:strand:- start:912 stop:1124 length:213 start_codon:yes stop_codon:yes gene_type:complete